MRFSPTRANARKSFSATATPMSPATTTMTTSREDMASDHTRGATLPLDMERALAVLSDGERAAIVQCYHNDLSHEEAAYVLNCPVGTVKTHILRAKRSSSRGLRRGHRSRLQ